MKIFKHSLFILSLALFCSVLLCFADDVSNPQRQGGYEQCVRQCQHRRPGQVEECREICGERQGREPQRRSQEECERRCSWETRGQREQQQCERSCGGRRQDDDEDQNSHRDPRRRFEECSERCESQQRGQQQDCRRRCQKEYERESEREEHRRGRGDDNSQDPRQRYEQCQRQCQEHVRGQEAQQQCQTRCEEERHRQESEGRQHIDDESRRDPRQRYQECQRECRRQEKGSQQQQCQRTCQDQYERERQESERRRGRGDEANAQDPRRRFEECREACEKQERGGGSKQQCQRSCQQEYERQREESEQGRGRVGERGEQEQQDNPYFFQSGHFQESFRSSDGSLRFLPKFISKSRHLRGLNHFRFAHLQAGPNTVYLPHHSDSDSVCAVTRGKGTITFVNHEKKESFNIEQGNVVRVPAGNTVYIVNRQSNETLKVAIFVNPVNNPGEFEDFYPAGVESPRSYFRAFSTEILEQALNTPREQIEKLFQGREQQQGIIRRASEEQLRAIIRHASSRSSKRDIRSPIDLTNQKPVYSNDNGRFFEAVPSETFRQLEDIDISVGIIDLKQDAMFAPHFNTRTTYVVHVAEGEAQVEMACPHLSRGGSRSYERREEYGEEEEERTGQIQSVRFRVSAGDVFIIPAGHPITMVATGNQNLIAVGFGANARNNERVFLAGRENLLRQMDSEVKEVAFGVPAKLVDEIFSNPKESYFLSRRGQRREQGGDEARPLSSIVDELTRLF